MNQLMEKWFKVVGNGLLKWTYSRREDNIILWGKQSHETALSFFIENLDKIYLIS